MSRKKVVIPLAAGDYLHDAGYSVNKSERARHTALNIAVRDNGYRAIVPRLNAVSIRLRNTAPRTYDKLRADMAYLKKKYRPDS